MFDGTPRKQISRSVLTSALAMVEQDIFLFGGTVREKLTLGDSTVAPADLVKACQDAAIHDTILSLPGGYEAKLIEGGMNLSGGQRQRLKLPALWLEIRRCWYWMRQPVPWMLKLS